MCMFDAAVCEIPYMMVVDAEWKTDSPEKVRFPRASSRRRCSLLRRFVKLYRKKGGEHEEEEEEEEEKQEHLALG
jgi:hypothetical protein